MNFYKGARRSKFSPRNPSKWVDPEHIIARSGLETKFFTLFDLSPNVIKIASEKIIIPYFDKANNKQRRYYTDLIVQYKTKSGEVKTKLIEIKSYSETIQPKKPKRITENYKHKVITWITNSSKWDAATRYAEQRGFEFCVLSERDL